MHVPSSHVAARRRGARSARGGLALPLLVAAVLIAAAIVVIVTLARKPAAPPPKSVLLITLDTTRADHLGCYGRAPSRTPHLDRLAAEGVVFARCLSPSPITLPSHASIMTALYPYAHGARLNGVARLSDANVTLAETLKEAGFQTRATVASVVLNTRYGVSQGFDVYHDVLAGVTTFELEAERKGNEIADDALEMLDALAGRPFFLWVHFFDPHHPYESERVPDTSAPAAYEDEIAFMDAQVGRVLARLRALGLDQSTLIIAVGDHGESLGEHGENFHGVFLYDATTRVPLIVRSPGAPAGRVVAGQVRTIDLAPTVLDWLGLPGWDHAQGVSLLPMIGGSAADAAERPAYAESLVAEQAYGAARLRAWSDGGWKYILTRKPELYDLAADPDESENVIAANAEHVAALHGALRQLIADAPPPPTDDATAYLSGPEQAALESLGYVASGGRPTDEGVPELEQFEPHGPNPADHIHLFEIAQQEIPPLMEQKRYAEAEAKLREFLAALPDSPQQLLQLAEVLHAQGHKEEAEAAIRRALEVAPDDYMLRRRLARFLALQDRLEEARDQFVEVLRIVPDDVFSLEFMGQILLRLGQPEAARDHLEAVLALEPDHGRTLRTLGFVSVELGKYEEALAYFEHALRVFPECPGCADAVAKIKAALGRS